jgi:hypothetical protein
MGLVEQYGWKRYKDFEKAQKILKKILPLI